ADYGVVVFMAFPDIVVRLLFGEHYLAAVTALQILACNAIAGMTLAILASMIAGIGKPIVNTKVIGAMAGLNFFGNLILIPPYGIEGAAMATLLSTLLGVFISFYYAKKFVEFTLPTSPIFKTLIGAALTLLLISGLKSAISLPPWPEAFVVTILGLLFYGGWVFATGAITRGDVRLVTSIIPMPTWLANFVERFARS
ncbi:MAG: polysaccharide biosynthesis C-terminal domain-containing protein, partial [Candidatus Hadarchaeales archaeon]